MAVLPEHGLVLIIGMGYLGSALAIELRRQGYQTVGMDKLAGSADFVADISDYSAVARTSDLMALSGLVPDVIVFCVSTHGGDIAAYRDVYWNGVRYVKQVWGCVPVLFCSSSAVYGVVDGSWVTENSIPHPLREQGKILMEAEREVLAAGGIVGRLSALYGPGRCVFLDRYLQTGKAIAGAPDRWVNYIHRDDAVSALICLMNHDQTSGKIFNISDEHPIRLQELYRFLSCLLERDMPDFAPPPQEKLSSTRRGSSCQQVSCKRLCELGWKPFYPGVADGVHNVLEDWMMVKGGHWRQ